MAARRIARRAIMRADMRGEILTGSNDTYYLQQPADWQAPAAPVQQHITIHQHFYPQAVQTLPMCEPHVTDLPDASEEAELRKRYGETAAQMAHSEAEATYSGYVATVNKEDHLQLLLGLAAAQVLDAQAVLKRLRGVESTGHLEDVQNLLVVPAPGNILEHAGREATYSFAS